MGASDGADPTEGRRRAQEELDWEATEELSYCFPWQETTIFMAFDTYELSPENKRRPNKTKLKPLKGPLAGS